jgi:hypothetical protein
MPGRFWNYRVIEFTNERGQTWRAVHEVHYVEGTPRSYSENPAALVWDPEEGDDSPIWMLDKIREAFSKPVLNERDFVGSV